MTHLRSRSDGELTGEERARLDETLAALSAPPADDALRARLLDDFDAFAQTSRQRPSPARGPSAIWRRFAPAGALAALSAAGFFAGAATARAPEDALAYAEAAIAAPFSAGAALWEETP